MVQVCLKCRHNVNTGILWIQKYYECRNIMNTEKLWMQKYYECIHVNYNYRRIINTNIL